MHTMDKLLLVHAMLATALLGTACKDTGAQSPTAEGSTAVLTDTSDGEVAAALAAVDRGEIAQGTLAQARASDPRVRAFGAAMVTMHTDATSRMSALCQRANITPREGDRSRRLASDGAAVQQRLDALRGAEFDRAYVDAQVAQHGDALALIDNTLVAMSHHADLRAALTGDVRPMVAEHLRQARELQRALAAPTNAVQEGSLAPMPTTPPTTAPMR